MTNSIFNDGSYKDLTSKQIKELITYIQDNNFDFSITCNIEGVNFSPKLPEDIYNNLQTFTLFSLANFTLSSLEIKDNHIEFETGFGASNFGSVCTIPYYAILQISMQDSILFINPVATIEKYFEEKYNEEDQIKRSMNSFSFKK